MGFLASLFGHIYAYTKKESKAKGWGDAYQWYNLEQGLTEAAKARKPLMLIVHRHGCADCIQLRKRFASCKKMQQMANDFIFVNANPHELPADYSFAPDGSYVPRVMFFTPRGYLMRDVVNQYRNNQKFTYSDPAFVSDSMKQAMSIITTGYTNQLNSKVPIF